MSHFAWLDYSEKERRRMMDVIDLFREKGTVDELGLGTIRDAIADRLFPGTSTVMSRARYYLLVPWTYRSLEARQVPATEFARRARNAELALIPVIAESDDREGNIGRRARFALKRLPSSIYWAGLRVWGIRNGNAPQADYHRSIDALYRRAKVQRSRSEARDVEHDDFERDSWHGTLPAAPANFPRECSLRLRDVDAEFLAHRVCTAKGTRNSLLAELVHRRVPWDEEGHIWQHPDAASWRADLCEIVHHARMFSEIMHGAVLLYNHLLMGLLGKESVFTGDFDEWADLMEDREAAYGCWNKSRFWEIVREQNPRLGARATTFAESWWDMVAKGGARRICDSNVAHRLVKEREVQLKGKLARLANLSARERWNQNSGTGQLDYRWGITQTLLKDIFDGLPQVDDPNGNTTHAPS